MEIGKIYKVLGENDFHPELQPEGTVVQCVGENSSGYFIVELVDNCGKKIDVEKWIVKDDKDKFILI